MTRPRVKICGITSARDAEAALDFGADAIGLVFAESPRRVTEKTASAIVRAVGPWMAVVGVFVNERPAVVRRIAESLRLSAVQLHGEESADEARALRPLRVIKAFRISEERDLEAGLRFPADAVLFDTRVSGVRGGSGRCFDWKILKKFRRFPFIVSGGLTPRNVGELLRALRPYGVDVSSGVEKKPGVKDHRLMKEFIRNAKAF